MLKQLPFGCLEFYFVRSFGSLSLILELITQLLIIVNHFVSLKRGACRALGRFLFSQLLLSQFPCICIIYLKSSLGSSIIYGVFYAINWVHKLSGFENPNPCDNFLVRSIVEASSRALRNPVRKAEPITPEILGLILQHYGKSSNLLDIRFVCMCLLAYAGFFRISELLSIRRSNIVTEHLYHKIFIEVSKTDRYREVSWVYIAKTGNFTCPYTYLIKYLEAARIPSFSQNFIFRSLRYDKDLKGNV